jgi:CubicO group peptidase (beta-lactamase class C family)
MSEQGDRVDRAAVETAPRDRGPLSRRSLLIAVAGGGLTIATSNQAQARQKLSKLTSLPSPTTLAQATPTTVPPGSATDGLIAFLAARQTDSFLLVRDGIEAIRWSRPGVQPTRDVASVQKSVTSLLVGRAVQDGKIRIGATVASYLGARWTAERRETTITVEQLLTMTSGLDDNLQRVAAPGTQWFYNTVAYAQLHLVLEKVTGIRLPKLADKWLFAPIGAKTARFSTRQGRNASGAQYGLTASTDDLVRIGQLVLDGGRPLLKDRSWLHRSFQPSQKFNSSYGWLWWLNGQAGGLLPGPNVPAFTGSLIPAAPSTLVAAWGSNDQKLYVVPDKKLIVARLGERGSERTTQALSTFDQQLWEQLAALGYS